MYVIGARPPTIPEYYYAEWDEQELGVSLCDPVCNKRNEQIGALLISRVSKIWSDEKDLSSGVNIWWVRVVFLKETLNNKGAVNGRKYR